MKRHVTLKGDEVRRAALIARLLAARKRILEAVSSLPPQKQDEIFLGEWSVKDLLAHLIGWDYTCIAAIQDLMAEQLPAFYALRDTDWASYNRQLVRSYKKENWAELLAAVTQSHQELLALLQTIPTPEFEKDWGVRYDGNPVTIDRLLQAEAKDDEEHCQQLVDWLG